MIKIAFGFVIDLPLPMKDMEMNDARTDLVPFGLAWPGLARLGLAWPGLASETAQ